MKYWILLVLVSCGPAFALGDGAGNGDAVRCGLSGDTTSPLRLLDFFEKEPNGSFKASLGQAGLSATQKALLAIERIRQLDPVRYARYHDMAATFLNRARMVSGPLFDYNDTGPVKIPSNCTLVPVSIQRPAIDPSDKPFTVDTKVWGELPDDDDRAGVILHEVIYNETLALGQQTSESARRFTGLLASSELDNISTSDYKTLTDDIFLPHLPRFVSDVIVQTGRVGQMLSIDLFKLLSTVPNQALSWGTTSDKPSWLNLDIAQHKLWGTPSASDAGTDQFDLVVRDEEGEALALIQLNILQQAPSLASVLAPPTPFE